MAVTLTADGIVYPTGTQSSVPFMYQHVDTSGTAIGSTQVTILQTPDWQTPAKSNGVMWMYIPQRNDSGTWGGHHLPLYYRINSGNWVGMGQSGYSQTDTTMAYNGGGRIDTQCQCWNFDFSSITSDFTVAFRVDAYRHDGDGAYLNSCDCISSGNSTYTFDYSANGTKTASGGAYSCGHIAWYGVGF